MTIRPAPAILLSLLLCAPFPALAESTPAATPWYQIELFVFAQRDDNLMAEYWDERVTAPTEWPTAIPLIDPDADPAAVPAPTRSSPEASLADPAMLNQALNPLIEEPAQAMVDPVHYRQGAYRRLPDDAMTLPVNQSRFSRRGFRPLFHAAWRQPTVEREQAATVYIESSERLASGLPAVLGTIEISLSRYLHFNSALYFNTPLPPGWVSQRPPTAQESAAAAALAANALTTLAPSDAIDSASSATQSLPAELLPPTPQQLTLKLAQSRRMRSDELHYIDHPLYGVLVRISSYELPAPVSAPLLPTAASSAAASTASTARASDPSQ